MKLPERMENGQFPAFAWPGGYPIVYLVADGSVICPDCANGENGSEASPESEDEQWKLVDFHVHYEGPPQCCEHCGVEVESAYGEVYEGPQ
jgi:hypothetical protein